MIDKTKTFSWDSIMPKNGVTLNPAINNFPATVTVPAGKKWKLLSVSFSLVTSAVAGNRYAQLDLDFDGVNSFGAYISSYAHVASTQMGYSFLPGAGTDIIPAPNGRVTIGIGPIILPSGASFVAGWANLQAGDDASPMNYSYLEAPT